MKTRTAFNPRPRPTPRQPNTQVVSRAVTGSDLPLSNPYTPAIPTLVFDETGQIRNIGAVVSALKACVESLAGQRGDRPNRAVIFKDLVDFGLLSEQAVESPHGAVGDAAPFRLPPTTRSNRKI
jgi:hypothetical protein